MKRKTDKQIVLDILFETFSKNKASFEVVKQDRYKDKRFKRLLKYSYFFSERFGKIYLSDDKKACALIIDSEQKTTTIRLVFWYIKLLFKVIGFSNVKKVLHRLKVLNQNRPKESHIYVWYIGVKESEQRKGLGLQLMKQVLLDHKGRTICLETTKKSNYPFYEKLGFSKTKKIEDLEYEFVSFRIN